ncbi:MAG: hypothetical protein ACKN9V_02390 [Pseudomonadota bacterium]
MKVLKKEKRIISILMICVHWFFICSSTVQGAPDPVGLLWTTNRQNINGVRQIKIEREIIDQVENKWGRRLLKPATASVIPTETLRLAQLRQKLLELGQKLSEIVFQSDSNIRLNSDLARELIREIKHLSSHLPKGTFGPEIQWSRLVQAAWFWRNKDNALFQRLYREARDMHPLGNVNFEGFGDQPLVEVFESDCHKIKVSKPRDACDLSQFTSGFDENDLIWINGFKLESKSGKMLSGNFLVIKRNAQGKVFEKVIRCGDHFSAKDTSTWFPLKAQLRIEHLIPSEFNGVEDLLILAEESKGVGKYHFSTVTGLTEWQSTDEQIRLQKPVALSFESTQEKKWYNNKVLWWVGGALLAAGSWMISTDANNSAMTFKLKLTNGL